MNSRYSFMNHDRELVRRGVIVPVFKTKPPTDILNFKFKDKYYLSYLKARSKVRALKLGNTEEWKKYCYLHTKLPYGVPESPEIVYRNSGWTSFKDWLGFTTIKKPLVKSKKIIVKRKKITEKSKLLKSVKNYKFSKLASKRLPKAQTAIRLIGNLSNRSSYRYEEKEVQKIFKDLSKAMRELRKKFNK